MKNLRQRRFWTVLISALVLCLVASTVTVFVLHRREVRLEDRQNEALQALYDNKGRYDEQSIVLSNTTKARAEALAKLFGATLRITEDGSFAALTLPQGVTVIDIYENEDYRKYIEYMSPDYRAKISDLLAEDEADEAIHDEKLPLRPQYTVSDADYDRQTYLDFLNMRHVWERTQGSGVTVAVIDTGIDTDHPEFAGRISELSYNASEDKVVKDYLTADGVYDWSLIEDEQGHGTAVAGVIAASMDGSGIVGIAPQVNILVIKAECDENGVFERTSDLVFGLYYAIERDVAVVNMSFGLELDNPFAEPAQLAFDSDVICVAAAGNSASAVLTYPAADENVFGIGALEENGWTLAAYSNYGENVDIVAPGTVYTTQMGGDYGGKNGTSFASPIAAGVLALYLSQYRYQEFVQIEALLHASCDDLGDPGPDFTYGYGALDVSALMLEERGTVTFNMMTDELDDTEQIFIRAHTLQDIPEPERLYAVFDGWYYDPQCTEAYVWYEDEFYGDLTLYASWVNEDDGIPFTYAELDDGTVEIRSYTGHRRYITIPDYIDGKVVSSIGEAAFAGETRLREVNLPKYLSRIRRSAFSGCTNLVSMAIPDTVTEIGDNAFYDNVRLANLTFGENSRLERIGNFAFSGCAKLRTFTVPSKVTTLNATAFYRNTSMTAYRVQSGNKAFSAKNGVLFNHTGLVLVAYPAGLSGTYTVPETVQKIDLYAFSCTRLNGVNLSSVQTLGKSAFMQSALKQVDIPDSVTLMGDSVFAYSQSLRSVKIGRGLTSLPDRAFAYTALTAVDIPAGILSVGRYAFERIGTLHTVTFEKGSALTYIDSYAFYDSGVVSLTIPASVVTIANNAFAAKDCPYLSHLSFEDNSALYRLGSAAFAGQSRLTAVELPDRLTTLGDWTFTETGLVTVTIPSNVTSLGSGVFADCPHLTGILVDDKNPVYLDVDGIVFNTAKTVLLAYPTGHSRPDYAVPEGVTDIGKAAFNGARNLYAVYLASTVKVIREEGFYGCENVGYYGLPEGLTTIEAYAFSMNEHLNELQMPDSLMQIGVNAFAGDRRLYAVNFSDNAKLPRISYNAFAYCGLISFRVPAGVSTIAQGAFKGCSDLTSVTFASGSKLQSIPAYMFDGCDKIDTVIFEPGSALSAIQAHGFEGMRKLTTLDFGDAKLTNIDNFAFRFCERLSRLDIPDSVTFIGRYAFYYCEKLSEVTIPAAVEFIGRFAFLGTSKLNVYFAAETLPSYLAEDWDHGIAGYYLGVTDIVTDGDWTYARLTSGDISIIKYSGTATHIDLTALHLGGDIVNVGGGAFAGSGVTSVKLPETLQIIQAEAFSNTKLTAVSIPAGVTFIGREAFANTPIERLTFALHAQLKTMEQSAFERTEKLESVVIPETVTAMGRAVFKNSGITSLTFADGFAMTEIPEEAFAYTHISDVTIPDSVTVIGHSAFREIRELRSLTLGGGEDLMIMSNAFYQTGLEQVYLPENVSFVGEYAFIALPNLSAFTVSEHNPNYKAIDGLLVSKNGRKLIAVPSGRTGSLTVPEGVEVIGFGAFESSKLSEISFLDSANILSFGYRAFYNADGISSMHVPASVVSIDYYAFAMCDSLKSVTFAESNSLKGVYEGAFYSCPSLSDITLPDSIVEISDFAFYGCRSLTDLPISEAGEIKGIYDYAFAYAGLKGNYTIPDTLIDIGPYAFMGNQFTSVTVPDTRVWDLIIGIGAFENCSSLSEITLPFIGASFEDAEITWFGYIFGAGAPEANGVYVPESLKRVKISEGITFVGEHAFDGLAGLEEISVPHSVQTVHDYAFHNTRATYELTNTVTFTYVHAKGIRYEIHASHIGRGISGNLVMADGITKIDNNAFANCQQLTGIMLPDSVKSIGSGAFLGCSGLTSLKLPESVMLIDYAAFMDCGNLESIHIPDRITTIHSDTFNGCRQLTSVVFGENSQLTSINASAFAHCDALEVISLPKGVTFIGRQAFFDCTGLLSITIPDAVTTMEYGVFDSCDHLASVTFGENSRLTSLPDSTFYACGKLSTVTLPGSLVSIGNQAFRSCESLTDIVMPDTVTSLGDEAFYACRSLNRVVLSEGLVSLSPLAFCQCESLTSITLPDSIVTINRSAFDGCSRLSTVVFGENSQLLDIEAYAFGGCHQLKTVTIPDTVTSIGEFAFYECNNLLRITFGADSQLERIGRSAFEWCQSLSSFDIPKNVTSIDDYAFWQCQGLYAITNHSALTLTLGGNQNGGIAYYAKLITDRDGNKTYDDETSGFAFVDTPDGFRFVLENGEYRLVAYMGDLDTVTLPSDIQGNPYSIYRLKGVKKVIIPEAITAIGAQAFYGSLSLTGVTLPNTVSAIGEEAFAGCLNLTAIHIPASVTEIGNNAFVNCQSMESVTFDETSRLTSIGYLAFQSCNGLTAIEIPASVTSIGNRAFEYCQNLTSVSLADNSQLTSIGDSMFYQCTSLASVDFGENSQISEIGGSVFSGCSKLTGLVLPDSVTRIESRAFEGCESLTSLRIPDGLTYMATGALKGCVGIQLLISDHHASFSVIDGVLYDKDVRNLIYVPDSITELCIPNTVIDVSLNGNTSVQKVTFEEGSRMMSLNNAAFKGCVSLMSVTLPESILWIGYDAFADCESLVSIRLPDGVTEIGGNAFKGCVSLESIHIPNGVTSMGQEAFSGCKRLTDICLPEGLISIGDDGFLGCESLESIYIPDGVTSLGWRAFSGCLSLATVTFGDNSQLTSIPSYAFSECERLLTIRIPDGVTQIGSSAFQNCHSLTEVVFGSDSQLINIGSTAFSWCENLKKLDLGNNRRLESIEWWAFLGCDSLEEIYISDVTAWLHTTLAEHHPLSVGADLYLNGELLTELVVPDGITDVTLSGCTSLISITLPESVTRVDFSNCTNLTRVTFRDNSRLTTLPAEAFRNCEKLSTVTFGNNSRLTSIEASAFSHCVGLKLIDFGQNSCLESIGYNAFEYCANLTDITLPDSLKAIGPGAFFGCNGLTSFTLPENLTSIEDAAFTNCTHLYVIYNNSSLVLQMGSEAHGGITAQARLIVDRDGNRTYRDDFTGFTFIDTADGFRFMQEQGEYKLIAYLGDLETVTFPTDLNGSPYQIYQIRGVKHVIIPEGVTSIDAYAFYHCTTLESIILPDSLIDIGAYAFENCHQLTRITLPSRVTTIGRAAFSKCAQLTEITLPESVEVIKAYAFEDCTRLSGIKLPAHIQKIESHAFDQTAYKDDPAHWVGGVLYIGNHLIRVKEDTRYVDFKNVGCVAEGAFDQCYLLKNALAHGEQYNLLSDMSNLETLLITDLPAERIYAYFGRSASDLPLTLKSIVLGRDVRMNQKAFEGITGITIYVEANEKDVRWDENFPGWSNGNKVVYGDEWITADFYDQHGNLMSHEVFLTHQVIRQPYLRLDGDLETSRVLVGWDLDGDGSPDTIPATSTVDIVAKPVVKTQVSAYTVRFYDTDGVTLLSEMRLPYGAVIVPPTIQDKPGYTTMGWTNYTQGMTVSGHHAFVLNRVHQGGGHDYASSVWVAPTCTEGGYLKHVCQLCGAWYATEETAALGHRNTLSEIPATCTEEGKRLATCTVCGYVSAEIIPAHGHTYVGSVTKEATCTEQGEMLYVCAICGDRVTETTSLSAHHYEKRTAPKWWLQILIEKILNVFFGYEGDHIFYYECTDCRHIRTSDNTEDTSSGTAGIMSAGCAHQLSDWTVYISPTCEGEGVDARYCTVCGEPVSYRRGGDALGHDYSAHRVTAPTCTEEGYTTHICLGCGDSYTDSITDALGHTAGAEADCLHDQLCLVCGTVLSEKLGHTYDAVVTAPTCIEEGYTTYTCTRCGDSYTDSITDALGHTAGAEADCINDQLCLFCGTVLSEKLGHTYAAAVTDPTCTEPGYTTYTCVRCGDSYTDNFTDALGHTPGPEANCYQDQCCLVCGSVLVGKLGHDYQAFVTEPTCTEQGYTTYSCVRCGYGYTGDLTEVLGHTPGAEADCYHDQYCTVCGIVLNEKLGHEYMPLVTQPTCTEEGYVTHICFRCDDRYVDSFTPAWGHTPGVEADCYNHQFCLVCGVVLTESLGHDYWMVVTEPTCTEPGYTTHTCVRCGDSYTDGYTDPQGHTPSAEADCYNHQFCLACGVVLTDSLGHDYAMTVTEPTCTEQGYTTHTCVRCGDSYTDGYTDPQGHIPSAEADCYNHQFCLVCGVVLTESLGHDYAMTVTEPTCTEQGYTTHTCVRCGDSYTDGFTEARGHNPSAEADCDNHQFCLACGVVLTESLGHDYAMTVTEPTCTEQGYTTHTCVRCGDSYTDGYTDPQGHIPSAEADCDNHQFCLACGVVLTESLGHDYAMTVTEPTCTEQGYTTHTCVRCGDSYTDGDMEALGHAPGEWITDQAPAPGVEGSRHIECTVCGEILEIGMIEALPTDTALETEAETSPETPAPADSDVTTVPDSQPHDPHTAEGCKSMIGANALGCFIVVSLAVGLVVKRRKEND